MNTKNERLVGFEGKPKYSNKFQFSSFEGNYNRENKHEFVVPWQMVIKNEEEFVLK